MVDISTNPSQVERALSLYEKEINDLRAENERLKADLEVKDTVQQWRVDWLAMEAENERLLVFIRKVALFSNDWDLADEAEKLVPGASL